MLKERISSKVYNKAYYKYRKRKKAIFRVEKVNSEVSQFLFEHKPDWYARIFKGEINSLFQINYEELDMSFGVIRKEVSKEIVFVFALDGSGVYAGNLDSVEIDKGIKVNLDFYNVH